MQPNRDFRDLFAALNAADVRYLLVGGYALAFHHVPRFTKDLDVWVEPTAQNARNVLRALRDFGAPLAGLEEGDMARPGIVFQIGVAPVRIDVLTAIDGVEFVEGWAGRVTVPYGDQTIQVIGRAELVRNKRATGRPQDGLDADVLEHGT